MYNIFFSTRKFIKKAKRIFSLQKTTYICSVKEFIRHIEILLLDNDCVVIPGFGGFVTSHAPSTYIEDENLFLPPIRTVGFNDQLKEDDGLLRKAYCTTYNISEQEAKDLIASHIQAIEKELLENGICDMGSLGTFTIEEGNIRFSPCEAGTVCPSFYGLDAIVFPKLETNNTDIKLEPNKGKKITVNSDEIVIRIKKTWLNNIAAVAAVVILFLIISPKAQNTGIVSSEKADFALLMSTQPTVKTSERPNISSNNKKNDNSEKKAEVKNEKTSAPVSKPTAKATSSDTQTKKTEADNKEDGIYVVVASAIPEANAKAFVAKLHKEGYTDATLYKKGKMIRVVFSGFASEAEAYQKLKSLRQRSDRFNSAWVLSNK